MDVYAELEQFSRRHEKLTAVFKSFCKDGTAILTSAASNLRGIKVSEPSKGGTFFDVSLAGTTARFLFTFLAATSKGRVSCFRLDPLTSEVERPAAGSFDFNGQGEIPDKTDPGTGDRVRITTDSHAALVIAELLHQALTGDRQASAR